MAWWDDDGAICCHNLVHAGACGVLHACIHACGYSPRACRLPSLPLKAAAAAACRCPAVPRTCAQAASHACMRMCSRLCVWGGGRGRRDKHVQAPPPPVILSLNPRVLLLEEGTSLAPHPTPPHSQRGPFLPSERRSTHHGPHSAARGSSNPIYRRAVTAWHNCTSRARFLSTPTKLRRSLRTRLRYAANRADWFCAL